MATLAEALYGMPADRLRTLATLRDLDPKRLASAPDKRQLVQFMATELSKPPSVSRAVLRCNARELRLLQLLFTLDARQSVSWRSVLEAAGGPNLGAPLGAVLAGLENLGLAFRVGDSVLLVDAVRHQVPRSLSDHYTVRGCLQSYDAPTLRTIAERLGADGGTKAENVEAIARRLLHSNKALFGQTPLGPEEQAALDYIVQAGGAVTAVEVASAVLKSTDDFFRYDWQNRWKMGREKNAIDRLLARGMIYVVSYAYGFNLFLVIPGDLLRLVTGESRATFWTSPVPAPALAATVPATTVRQTALIRDVVALFGFISTQEAARTNTGYIHKTSLKHIARTLSLQDERYATFLYALCRQAGTIAPMSEKQTYGVTDTGHSWLGSSALDQVQSLYNAWRKGDFWGEMYSEPLKRSNEFRPADAVVTIREAALELVAVRPSHGFVDTASLTDALSFRYPLLLTQNTQLGGDLVASPANFMRLLIGECLYWLGLVELGWNVGSPTTTAAGAPSSGTPPQPSLSNEPQKTTRPDNYRLTAEGAYLLGVDGAPAPEEPPAENQFILQANAEIFLPPYLEAGTLFHVLLITEVPGKTVSGNIVSLTRESIRRALDQGISGKAIVEFLQTHARTGIPQNVAYLINEVSDKHGHIHIGRAQMYVQVDSPLVLKELQARRELKDYFVRTLGDRVAILNAPEPDKLLKDLRKAGYLPISDDAPKGKGFRFGDRGTRAKRIPGPPPSSEAAARAATVEKALNWDRIARDDGRSWREPNTLALPVSQPEDAVQDKGNIRYLLLEAIRATKRVQIAHQGHGDAAPQIRLIEPRRVMGNFVVAYLPIEAEEVTLNINRMSWARATGDGYVPP
jgi:hypothetical protein